MGPGDGSAGLPGDGQAGVGQRRGRQFQPLQSLCHGVRDRRHGDSRPCLGLQPSLQRQPLRLRPAQSLRQRPHGAGHGCGRLCVAFGTRQELRFPPDGAGLQRRRLRRREPLHACLCTPPCGAAPVAGQGAARAGEQLGGSLFQDQSHQAHQAGQGCQGHRRRTAGGG